MMDYGPRLRNKILSLRCAGFPVRAAATVTNPNVYIVEFRCRVDASQVTTLTGEGLHPTAVHGRELMVTIPQDWRAPDIKLLPARVVSASPPPFDLDLAGRELEQDLLDIIDAGLAPEDERDALHERIADYVDAVRAWADTMDGAVAA